MRWSTVITQMDFVRFIFIFFYFFNTLACVKINGWTIINTTYTVVGRIPYGFLESGLRRRWRRTDLLKVQSLARRPVSSYINLKKIKNKVFDLNNNRVRRRSSYDESVCHMFLNIIIRLIPWHKFIFFFLVWKVYS